MSSAQWRLTQRDAQTWDSHLRLPEDFEGRLLPLQPQWPASCERLGEPRQQPADEGMVLRWTLRCPQGLAGQFGLQGFNVQLPDAVLLIEPLHGAPQYAVLSASRPQWQHSEAPPPPPVASAPYSGAPSASWQLPSAAVEASIAASILLLAVELATGAEGLALRRPASIAFGFGLLHGFGFAGALAATGLPEGAQAWALAAFNLGVEFGQLLFVLALLGLAALARPLWRYAPLALSAYGAVAAYWLLQRAAVVFTGANA